MLHPEGLSQEGRPIHHVQLFVGWSATFGCSLYVERASSWRGRIVTVSGTEGDTQHVMLFNSDSRYNSQWSHSVLHLLTHLLLTGHAATAHAAGLQHLQAGMFHHAQPHS